MADVTFTVSKDELSLLLTALGCLIELIDDPRTIDDTDLQATIELERRLRLLCP